MKKIMLFLLLPLVTKAQIITTVFGPNTTLNCGGWGSSIATDRFGNYYISQECDNSVYKVTPPGVLTKIAGNGSYAYSGDGGPATAAALYEPMGVAVDHIGNVYIADMSNERIRKVDTFGIITTIAGVGTSIPTVGGFGGDGGPATDAQLFQPAGLYVDDSGNIFIADGDNSRIRKINSSGIINTIAGGGTSGPGDGGPATNAELHEPISVTFDHTGNMYICDGFGGNRIRKVNRSGIISTVAGNGTAGYNGDGIIATTAELNIPRGVAVDADGNVYIMDNNEARIRKVDVATGMMTTFVGNGTAGFSGDGGLSSHAQVSSGNITIDHSNNLVISDLGNERIRKVNIPLAIPEPNVDASLQLYPNPANDQLTIASNNTLLDQVIISNTLGYKVISANLKAKQAVIDISQLPTGVYFVTINNLITRKIVKG